MIHKSRALIFGHRKLKLNPIDNACSNGSQFKYYISILGGRGVQNLVKHAYIIHEWSLKTISLKFSLEHFKQFASLPHLMFYPWFFISDYYRSLSIAIALKYYYQYHYHYRSKSHYRTSLTEGSHKMTMKSRLFVATFQRLILQTNKRKFRPSRGSNPGPLG